MRLTRYKPLFGISVSYELEGLGVQTQAVALYACLQSLQKMQDRKLKPRYGTNTVTVDYEGREIPAEAPVTCEPLVNIESDEFFYFSLKFLDKSAIGGLQFHSTPELAVATGFPLLYDAQVDSPGGTATVTVRDDIKVMLPLFTFTVTAADAGITTGYASLEVKDENENVVELGLQPVPLNDKSIDGVDAVPEFAFSVDASALQPGIYSFSVGNFTRRYFLAGQLNISDSTGLIRVLKNSNLEYEKAISSKQYALFELLIPAA